MTLSLVLSLTGCAESKIGLGGGSADDARFIADIYTWYCDETGEGDTYEGVFSYNITLEYAPDALTKRELPKSGCSKGLDLFPSDAGSGGTDIPESDVPQWANDELSGELPRTSDGFYYDDVTDNVSNCSYADELLGEGTSLSSAGSFSGARTPKPGTLANVLVSGADETSGIQKGTEVTASWDSTDWDEAWIQVRGETGGLLDESVTCSTEGEESYVVGDDVWSLMNSAKESELTNLYIVVQNTDTVSTDDGQTMHVLTRSIHAVVVN